MTDAGRRVRIVNTRSWDLPYELRAEDGTCLSSWRTLGKALGYAADRGMAVLADEPPARPPT